MTYRVRRSYRDIIARRHVILLQCHRVRCNCNLRCDVIVSSHPHHWRTPWHHMMPVFTAAARQGHNLKFIFFWGGGGILSRPFSPIPFCPFPYPPSFFPSLFPRLEMVPQIKSSQPPGTFWALNTPKNVFAAFVMCSEPSVSDNCNVVLFLPN